MSMQRDKLAPRVFCWVGAVNVMHLHVLDMLMEQVSALGIIYTPQAGLLAPEPTTRVSLRDHANSDHNRKALQMPTDLQPLDAPRQHR